MYTQRGSQFAIRSFCPFLWTSSLGELMEVLLCVGSLQKVNYCCENIIKYLYPYIYIYIYKRTSKLCFSCHLCSINDTSARYNNSNSNAIMVISKVSHQQL
ncbi:unnamed protein product [Ceratitis capitata]|uniref:(Mediterranean fruit fly) hypothetical protein n=1 Tax=Ceratitis capitata TaxID=7213 RepID=A0A811VM61_CERCA|nr:unnamed protein product [Ceratitis capitata]